MYLKQCEVESRIEYFKGDIQEILKSRSTIKKWAYILHDKDDTAPHYHIYLNFGNSGVDTKQVADWFGLQESQVNRIKGRSSDMLLYLTHGNDSQKNKYQYSPTEVISNFDFETEISSSKILGDFEHYSYKEQLDYIDSLPVSEKIPLYRKLNGLYEIRIKRLGQQTDRHIDVIFITGAGGTGKTYYAKELLKSLNLDFCISSSSNDFFQDYLGQKAIILDDLRDKAFINSNGTDNLEDLLKLLDNDTGSSVKSRFINKYFTGELIVITSSVPINLWFPNHKMNDIDSLSQLYRRIGTYIKLTKEKIYVYSKGLSDIGQPLGSPLIYKNDILERVKSIAVEHRDFSSSFSTLFGDTIGDVEPIYESFIPLDKDEADKLPF